MKKTFATLLAAFFAVTIFAQPLTQEQFEALAPTPPMGWNSWNKFLCNVSEELLMQTADAMVISGMKDAGYEYIVVDDCWQVDRDAEGNIVCDPERFPHGMKYVADYIHSLGLKFGLYSCVGTMTCAKRPGSMGHEYQDARTYASWGVDYLKYDFCNNNGANSQTAYTLMRDALKATGRPIVFSICEWGSTKPWEWGKGVGQLWRATSDILNTWSGALDWGARGVIEIVDLVKDLYPYAGPGHWNDPDMLEVGNGGMNREEEISHFSLWCMMAAPLMSGNDLRDMSAQTLEILTNLEVIALNQDPLGVQGHITVDAGDRQIWVKALEGGDIALCFLNRNDDKPWDLNYNLNDVAEVRDAEAVFSVRDLWKHKVLGTSAKNVKATIAPHGVLVLRLSKVAK